MNNKVIDLNFAKKLRESILSNEKDNSNINIQKEIYSMPMNLIINFHIDLAHLALGLTLNKDLKDVMLNDLIMILNRMSDIAIFLDIDLIAEVQEIQVTAPEVILNSLFNNVSMLNYKKTTSRIKMINRIMPLFVELVYSLGFTTDELEEAHHKNMDNNILELEQGIWKN
ncbi:MAG: hypothetical protein ACLUL3_10420 [Romboutsia timonensis]|uniref:hypothetical protein n=1 Tax=Romboutsia timonensis TaxID=1776391 RepID=UPI00265D9442|nr:hypothetical protein [uncultured Romboutsia sp.]